jgi:hypothetical protein
MDLSRELIYRHLGLELVLSPLTITFMFYKTNLALPTKELFRFNDKIL